MKALDLRVQTIDQLKEQLVTLKKESLNLRFQRAGGQLEGTARMGAVRRDIARINTVLTEKQHASNQD